MPICEPCGIVQLGPLVSPNPRCVCPVFPGTGGGGIAGGGAIIPFSTGLTPAALTVIAGGLVGVSAAVGFGASLPIVTVAGLPINLAGLTNIAFTVPRSGIVNAISANFQTTVALDLLLATATVSATLYRAPAGSNIFTPVPGGTVVLQPSLTGVISVGTLLSGSTGLVAPVAAGDRLMMVFSVSEASGLPILEAVVGAASAGVNIV
ncbi:exosporium glycoprotein BclB-related protein [Bacillus benzoevorans]|uniref:BclB C-terminal domain-containing protein n=1 Tax=Bacillus benzoevorans TaxID=1456 RepID=A0A7X0HQR1_9BACI|nr:exosporium glycoprotein BclB-related protein [Bacillus benzoevorans]MBB6445207.1 BclB C-terminal domain-containing protein [Bacillus benzoevorans]